MYLAVTYTSFSNSHINICDSDTFSNHIDNDIHENNEHTDDDISVENKMNENFDEVEYENEMQIDEIIQDDEQKQSYFFYTNEGIYITQLISVQSSVP